MSDRRRAGRHFGDATFYRYGLFALICIAFVASIAAVGGAALSAQGFPLDDSWIHQVIGRNLARSGVAAFTPGTMSSGSTSTIWPFIIALNYGPLAALSPVAFMLTINAACLFVAVTAIALAAANDRLPRADLACFALLPVLTGNFIWLAVTGMEHLLFVSASLTAAYLWIAGRPSTRNAAVTGLCIALAITTRLEAAVFVPIFLLGGWMRRRPLLDMLSLCTIAAIGILLVIGANYWMTGSPLPSTLSGRRWLWFGDDPPPWPDLASTFARAWVSRISRYFLFITGTGPVTRIAAATLVVLLLAAGLFRLLRARAHALLFMLAIVATTLALYLIIMPTPGHGGRYQAILMPFVTPLLALGAISIVRETTSLILGERRIISNLAQASCLTAAVLLDAASVQRWAELTTLGVGHVNNTHVAMGKWSDENLPRKAILAVFDIGAIGFYSNRRIVDLGGLVDPNLAAYRQRHALAEYVRMSGSTWLVLPTLIEEPSQDGDFMAAQRLGLDRTSALHMEQYRAFASAERDWRPGFAATSHALQEQRLFQITFEAEQKAGAHGPR